MQKEHILEWKWSDGSKQEKTKRYKERKQATINALDENDLTVIKENSAYLQSLNEEANWIQPQLTSVEEGNNQREIDYLRMAERKGFAQIGVNPFLLENDYLDVIDKSNQFLKPVSTNQDKISMQAST